MRQLDLFEPHPPSKNEKLCASITVLQEFVSELIANRDISECDAVSLQATFDRLQQELGGGESDE